MSQTPPTPGDAELLEQLRGGDPAAARLLSDRYRPVLVRFACSLLDSADAAEDVAQETLARLQPENLPSGELRPWLYRVARNLCLDLLRRRKVSPTFWRALPSGFDPARTTAGPGTRVANAERDARVRAILDAMPEEYRSVLMLKHVEGLSRAEIAEVLEVSEISVKGRLVRAAVYLRERLRGEGGSLA